MAKVWTYVRITCDTHKELCRVRESLRIAEMMGVVTLEPDNRNRVSLDQVITRLISIRDKHSERRKRSASRRASRKATKQPQPTDNGQAEEQLPLEGSENDSSVPGFSGSETTGNGASGSTSAGVEPPLASGEQSAGVMPD
jgi:hypothetical protein